MPNVPFFFHKISKSNRELSSLVSKELQLNDFINENQVVQGLNVTADSFYSSQGRIDPRFPDDNEDLIGKILSLYPNATSVEMETYMLLNLARCCNISIAATACAIAVANRITTEVIDEKSLAILEKNGGIAIIKAISSYKLE